METPSKTDIQLNYAPATPQPGLLRSLFKPSKKEIWSQLAQQMNAQCVSAGFFGRDKVVAMQGQWTVTLDTYTVSTGKSSVTYTRLRAPYVNKDGFRFTVYRSGFFTPLAQMLGFEDIQIGDPQFDEAFVLKGNNQAKVRSLFKDPQIKSLFNSQPRIRVEVKDDEGWFGTQFPEGVDELYFQAVGVIKDIELLHGLFELFGAILHQLCHIGSAYENDPHITLK